MPEKEVKTLMFSNDMVTCLMLKKELEQTNISFTAYPVYETALHNIKDNRPDIVITDLYSQQKKGWELVKTISEAEKSYQPKIIVFTAHPEKVTTEQRTENRIAAVIEKPVLDAGLFIEAIHKISR